ncbi:hypothetical protein EXS54_02995 [Patescibacteria group bacterium]|nr:hypothetical protein [Patescibacteria group bacterium]
MVKSASKKAPRKPAPKAKSVKPKQWHIRYWPALVGGVLLLGLVIILWQQLAQATFNDQLIKKLPTDSYLAGVVKLSTLDPNSANQLSASTSVEQPETSGLVDLLKRDGATMDQLRDTFDDQVAFAKSKRGNVAILTIKDTAAFTKLTDQIKKEATDGKTLEQLQKSGSNVKVWQGTLHNPDRTVAAYQSGREFYVGSTPEIVAAASQESNGFSSQEFFTDVSKQLPAGRDAYVFINASQMPQPPIVVPPMIGVGILNHDNELKLATYTADTPVAHRQLPQTDGSLLPSAKLAQASVQGQNVMQYLQLLEDQRQESDLPKVIALQNGLSSIDRKLGASLENDYITQAGGAFVYARYRDAVGKNQWFGALQFSSDNEAANRVTDLTKRLRERITVPVRHEILRTLQDGTQSREIVSEGAEALEIGDVSIEGHAGQQALFPSIGNVSWAVDGRYMIMGSSAEAAARMAQTIAGPKAKTDGHGDLAVQVKLNGATALTTTSDGLFDWILSTRPQSGSFTLNKQTGVLNGTVKFNTGGS